MTFIRDFKLSDWLNAVILGLVSAMILFIVLTVPIDLPGSLKLILMLITHIIIFFISRKLYLLEHGKRNRFLGRILSNLSIIFFSFIFIFYIFLLGNYYWKIQNFEMIIIIQFVTIMLSEFVLTCIHKILSFFSVMLW